MSNRDSVICPVNSIQSESEMAAHIEKLITAGQTIVQYWCDHEYLVPSKVIEAQKLFGYETFNEEK